MKYIFVKRRGINVPWNDDLLQPIERHDLSCIGDLRKAFTVHDWDDFPYYFFAKERRLRMDKTDLAAKISMIAAAVYTLVRVCLDVFFGIKLP